MTPEQAKAEILSHYRTGSEAGKAPSLDEAFVALDAAKLPEDFMSDADRDRRPPQERPELEKLCEQDHPSRQKSRRREKPPSQPS